MSGDNDEVDIVGPDFKFTPFFDTAGVRNYHTATGGIGPATRTAVVVCPHCGATYDVTNPAEA